MTNGVKIGSYKTEGERLGTLSSVSLQVLP